MVRSGLGACIVAAAFVSACVPAQAQHREQEEALRQRMQGRILPLREIERRVVPAMRGADYIGFDFDSETAIYTLKFLRDGTVIWVDVDGRSGQIVRRTGK